jgi:uncharacterized protein (TIGR02246 family)
MTTATPVSTTVTDDERAVLDVIEATYAAWADNDADAFAALYREDATVVQPGGIYKKNKAEIRTSMALAFAGPLKGSTVTNESKSVRVVGEDAAIVISDAGILMPGETDVPAQRMVRATWVLTRQHGTWLIAAFHNCSLN